MSVRLKKGDMYTLVRGTEAVVGSVTVLPQLMEDRPCSYPGRTAALDPEQNSHQMTIADVVSQKQSAVTRGILHQTTLIVARPLSIDVIGSSSGH